jgi:hypothetical protein
MRVATVEKPCELTPTMSHPLARVNHGVSHRLFPIRSATTVLLARTTVLPDHDKFEQHHNTSHLTSMLFCSSDAFDHDTGSTALASRRVTH